MPNDETSQEAVEQTNPEDESRQTANESGESQTTAAEESPSPEDIQRWRALEAKFKEQNVDPEQLLPEFTRRSQELKRQQEENARWLEVYQQQQRQQQAQADPLTALPQQIVEAEASFDHARAEQLRQQYAAEQARRIAREEYQTLSAQERARTTEQQLVAELKAYGIPDPDVRALAQRASQDPKAMAAAVAMAYDPGLLEKRALRDKAERDKRAAEASRIRPFQPEGGRNVPGEPEDEGPIRIPAATYHGLPESYWKKKLGDAFRRVVITPS